MPDALQIRSHLVDWIDGRSSLSEFEDWFVPSTWNIHKANDKEAEDLADDIELYLSEYSGGYLPIDQLRARLKELVNAIRPLVQCAKSHQWKFVDSKSTAVAELQPIVPYREFEECLFPNAPVAPQIRFENHRPDSIQEASIVLSPDQVSQMEFRA